MEPSSRESGTIKVFTVKEADGLLPRITKTLDEAFALNERIKSLTMDVESLISIWGRDVLDKGHIDNAYYFSKIAEREETFQTLIKKVNEIQALGCIVKDIDSGLVDFYYDKDGELVFLCWKYGEEKINHWHPVNEGFKSRREIKQLK